MFFTVKLKKIIAVVLAVLAVIFVALLASKWTDGPKTKPTGAATWYTLVIDPGHGGIDGGAIAADGSRESGINLAIALKMQAIAGLYGCNTVLTRDTEESSVTIDKYSEHDDLVRRADLTNSVPDAVLISVHQNKYPTPQPSGAQILYAATADSEALGKLMQANLVSFADPDNRRVAAPAPKKLLLTSRVTCPAVLAECGFMSNVQEAEKLNSGAYQVKLACALTASFIQFSKGTASI